MKAWRLAAVAAMLAGCGAVEVEPQAASVLDADSGAPIGIAPERDSGVQAARDASRDALTEASSPVQDARADVTDAGSLPADSGTVDAARDAALDAGSVRDASRDAAIDSSVDASQDSGSTSLCPANRLRCTAYAEEECTSGQWTRTYSQACCTDPARFVTSPDTFVDGRTGKRWFRHVISGGTNLYPAETCDTNTASSNVGTGWRTPTVAEMAAIVIGEPTDAGISVCSPAFDQQAFIFYQWRTFVASDGWFDFGSGKATGYPGNVGLNLICIHD